MSDEKQGESAESKSTKKGKRIIIVNRYFWPETFLINYISVWLAEEGYSVTVITGQPDYNPEANIPTQPRSQVWNGVEIKRIGLFRDGGRGILRNLNTQLFTLLACIHVLFSSKPDIVWCTSIPPVLQPFLLRVVTKLKRCKFLYFVQDIYPEIVISAGIVKENWLTRLAFAVDNWTIRTSDMVVTISRDMQTYLQDRSRSKKSIEVIRSFSTDDDIDLTNQVISDGPVKFVYAGNIGRFQNLESLVRMFVGLEQVQLILLGNGREKDRLKSIVENENIQNVVFYDFMPSDEAYRFVQECDVGIVTLSENIYKYAYPAKTYTYLGAGLPLLVFVESESELTDIVNSRGIGRALSWSQPPVDATLAIQELSRNLEDYKESVLFKTADIWKPERARDEWKKVIVKALSNAT